MLNKLRLKFVALNMILVTLVLVSAFSTICYLDYRTRLDEVYSTLDTALLYATTSLYDSHSSNMINGSAQLSFELNILGSMADPSSDSESNASSSSSAPQPSTAASASASSSASASASTSSSSSASSSARSPESGPSTEATASTEPITASVEGQHINEDTVINDGTTPAPPTPITNETQPLEIGGKGDHSPVTIPVAVYVVDGNGTISSVGDLTTASVTEGIREQAITDASEAGESTGYLNDVGLYYAKRTAFGQLCVAFADKSSVSSWQSLALMLTVIGAFTLLAFLIINLFFARWILRPVEAAWESQRQFTADASHELKTPLTVILANMAILKSHPDETIREQLQWIESTETEGEHMQLMVNDMLNLARPKEQQAAALESHMTDVDMSDLLEGDVLQFESVAFERGITITSDLDANVHVNGDEMRLHRLTSTLIDNACKYAEEGGKVTVHLRKKAKEAEFIVHNTGSHIGEEDLPHVFDRFYRADKARTRETSSGPASFGLGLSIARDVALEHGGDITVTSDPDYGTTFTATLPLAK